MTRTLTTLVIATLLSSTLLGQDSPLNTPTPNPVADLTSQIISRYLPATAMAKSETLQQSITDTDEVKQTKSIGYAATADLQIQDAKSAADSLLPMMPRMGSLPFKMPTMPFFGQTPRLPEALRVPTIAAPVELDLQRKPAPKPTPLPAAAMPQLRAFSAASSNGVHAIQALVPTDDGDEKVELKGTKDQIQQQLKSMSPEVQRIMSHRLGL